MGNQNSNHSNSSMITLTQEDIESLKTRTTYSEEEIHDLHAKFMNICPKGQLDKKNFVKFFSQFRADKDADMFCSQLFNAFDTDRSGTVDFGEFLIAISLAKDTDPKQKLRFAFKMYDTDNDNRLSLSEIEKIIEGIYNFNSQKDRDGPRKPIEVAKHMLKRFDKDLNGHLTEDEFIDSLADPTLMALESFSVFRSGTFHLASVPDHPR